MDPGLHPDPDYFGNLDPERNPQQIKNPNPDQHPDPQQSDRLDRAPDPHQFVDDKPKCYGI